MLITRKKDIEKIPLLSIDVSYVIKLMHKHHYGKMVSMITDDFLKKGRPKPNLPQPN